MADTKTPPATRTAAATRARMRARQERMAAELRERGWTVTPPDEADAVDLVAVVRMTMVDVHGVLRGQTRVAIVGPPAPGSTPRANLDGCGAHERASFIAPAYQVPRRADSDAQTRPIVDLLAAQGYVATGAWVCGSDLDARRFARVPVKKVTRSGER